MNFNTVIKKKQKIIIYFLNIRTLNRGEVSRHRDGVLSQITELVSWFNDIGYGAAKYENNDFEELLSAKVSQVEFKINNLNSTRINMCSNKKIRACSYYLEIINF